MHTITIDGKEYKIDPNSDEYMMQQLQEQGAEIIGACGGAGICQTCAFKPMNGSYTEKTEQEEMMGLPDEQRLSCQCLPTSDGEIELAY